MWFYFLGGTWKSMVGRKPTGTPGPQAASSDNPSALRHRGLKLFWGKNTSVTMVQPHFPTSIRNFEAFTFWSNPVFIHGPQELLVAPSGGTWCLTPLIHSCPMVYGLEVILASSHVQAKNYSQWTLGTVLFEQRGFSGECRLELYSSVHLQPFFW